VRVLLTPVPLPRHIFPMLPLARALRARGDDTAFAGPASLGAVLAAEDVQTITAGPEMFPDMVKEVISRTGVEPGAGAIDVETEAETLAAARIDLAYEDVLEAAHEWQPDLIVGDAYDYLGPMVASALNVPFGTVTIGQDLRPEQKAAARNKTIVRYLERGLAERRPVFVADICPPALQVDGWQQPEGWLPIRPEAHHAPDAPALVRSSRGAGRRPRVLLTFGTCLSDPWLLNPLATEITKLDVDLSVTLGPIARAEDFEVDSEHVRFEPFRPPAELLGDVDAVVCHAGAGTTYAALSAGIPLVVMPQGADQFAVADRAFATGAALCLLPGETSPHHIRAALTLILTEPAARDNAATVADQIAAMPTAAEVAESIAEFLR